MVCGLFQLYHNNYNWIAHLKLSEINKSVKSLKLLRSYADSFFSREKLGIETTTSQKAPKYEEKSWVYFKFCSEVFFSQSGGGWFIDY